MLNLKRFPALSKYLAINKYPNITLANKSALRNLWGDVWHKIGIEWSNNRVPGEKFIKRVYHADSNSLDAIRKIAEECGIKLINRINEDEIELIAPGAEDYSVIIAQDHYDDSLNYDYSDLEGLSITEAIDFLKTKLNKEIVPFDYIHLHFNIPPEFTGLRTKNLIHSPQSEEFHEFMMTAKSKLEATAKTLQNAVDMIEEPVKSKAREERETIARSFDERCTMMRKRHAFLNAMVNPFNSFAEFFSEKSEWCAILGINLVEQKDYLKITINFENGDYETYFAMLSNDGYLTISEIVGWQDEYCANSFLNISTQNVADEAEILDSKNKV